MTRGLSALTWGNHLSTNRREGSMTALLILLLVVILFGAGFALKVLWYVAIAALILWFIGFVAHGPERRWYRW